jgi:dual specificity phosphatase 12
MFQVEINTKKREEAENPLSVDEIEPRLFLGNVTAATNLKFLKSNNITHILTVDSCQIPSFIGSSLNRMLSPISFTI